MSKYTDHTAALENEQLAAEAFNRQSTVFDQLYNDDTIIKYKRQRVRRHVEKYLPPSASILELNAGTGEDTLYFASQGHRVHATDIAAGMLHQVNSKSQTCGLQKNVSTELRSFTDLANLENRGPFDLIFSNFAGLNCTDRLDLVLQELPSLTRRHGLVTLVILPQFCLWETLLVFKGKFRTATRRFHNSSGARAHIEGTFFKSWYYNPSYVQERMKCSFELISVEGLCTIVPPSYLQGFAEKYPGLYAYLMKTEDRVKGCWPFRSIGDYYIITMRRKP